MIILKHNILQEHQISCDELDESQTKASTRRVQVLKLLHFY